MQQSQSSILSIVTCFEQFNESIFQAKSEYYNLSQVEEAEADPRGPVVSASSNTDLASPTSDSLFAFTDESENETETESSVAITTVHSQREPSS